MKCTCGNEITVLKSNAGFYIGTEAFDPDINAITPYCRISQEYYPTEAEAWYAFKEATYTTREYAMEVQYCNKGKGCF